MTIDSGWVQILKTSEPAAFSDAMKHKPGVVFIDGQIKLMKPDFINTWQTFVEVQFLRTIQQAFDTGARVVVLAFDDYRHVPQSKTPTQRKRNDAVHMINFEADHGLPPHIPDSWPSAMRNRAFKNRVVDFVYNNVKTHCKLPDSTCSLVLDWQDIEVCGAPLPVLDHLLVSKEGRGECDIKAFSYMPLGRMLIFSTDGDYIPMSLIQLENNPDHPGIDLFRLRCKGKNVSTAVGEKRKVPGSRYEHVDVNVIYDFLKRELKASQSPGRDFATLVALVGCDFCMNLPYIGPQKIWRLRHVFAQCHNNMQDTALGQIVSFMLRMYKCIYSKHQKHCWLEDATLNDSANCFDCIASDVKKNTKTPARLRDAFWQGDRNLAHCQNVLWTIQYWTLLQHAPDPLSANGEFGFCRNEKGLVVLSGNV